MTWELVGPFEHHDIVVDGWRVPWLEGYPKNGGKIGLTLDRRMGVDLTVEEADRLIPFIADCIAVAAGYTAHPGSDGLDQPLRAHPMNRMHSIDLGGET